MVPVVFLMGATSTGKSTFMDFAESVLGNHVALIQVGKEFRKRYPPEHFKGSAAPDHTEKEAIAIFDEMLYASLARTGVDLILVDGQPRRESQVPVVLARRNAFMDYRFVMLNCSLAEQKVRAAHRAKKHADEEDPTKTNLWKNSFCKWEDYYNSRIEDDKGQLFNVWCTLQQFGHDVLTINTDAPALTYQHRVLSLICGGLKDVR